MPTPAAPVPSTVIPGLRYRDCLAAIEWLVSVLGFEKHVVYVNDDGFHVDHAELSFGNGMIMLGSAENKSWYSQYAATPAEIGNRETHSVSLIVSDCEPVYARVKASGAEILSELEQKPYGGKGFSCRDAEGYLWHLGEYNPWAIAPQK